MMFFKLKDKISTVFETDTFIPNENIKYFLSCEGYKYQVKPLDDTWAKEIWLGRFFIQILNDRVQHQEGYKLLASYILIPKKQNHICYCLQW